MQNKGTVYSALIARNASETLHINGAKQMNTGHRPAKLHRHGWNTLARR